MKYTIDFSTWRSGRNGEYSLGSGETQLLNDDGYMCCLGQCATATLDKDKLLNAYEPSHVGILYDANFVKLVYVSGEDSFHVDRSGAHMLINTELSDDAVSINDDEGITVEQRMHKLTKLFNDHGHELHFINVKSRQNYETLL